MSDFKDLLKKSGEEVKPPVIYPTGHYTWMVKGHRYGKSKQKQTPFVAFDLVYQAAKDDVDQQSLSEVNTSKTIGVDFYLTEDALYRLTDFLAKLGLNQKLSIEEQIPQATGRLIVGEIAHSMSQDGQRTFANINSFAPVE